MDRALLDNILGAAAAAAICVGGAIYVWTHAPKRKCDPDELTTIAEFANANDARLWKMRLETQGVHCILANEQSNTLVNPMLSPDFAAVRIQVLGCDVGRARRVLGAENRP